MNQYDLNGRVALITGGGSGLGRGIGQALAEQGAIVVAADIQTEPAEEAASALRQQGHQAMAVKMDVTDPASVTTAMEAALSQFGNLDILVNNAGITNMQNFEDISPADWEKENMKYALCFFPWVGLAVGAVSAVLFWLLQQIGAGSMLRAAVLTAVPVLVTGGIHLDGYLDTMDALSSWREKQRRLEILKDPHAGAFAIIMGCLYFVLYAGAAGELVWKIFPAYAFGFAVSRSFSGLSIAFFPNANPKGTAAAFGMSAEKKRTAAVLVVTIFAVTALSASFCVWAALDVLVVSALVFCYYKWKSSKYFGGITGDLAGYFLSLCELAQLLSLVVLSLGMENWK